MEIIQCVTGHLCIMETGWHARYITLSLILTEPFLLTTQASHASE